VRFFAARLVLILLPLTTTAARMHAHTLEAPDIAAQELNRCLKLVKIAASRRQSDRRGSDTPLRYGTATMPPAMFRSNP
jgi:hypothetical protein